MYPRNDDIWAKTESFGSRGRTDVCWRLLMGRGSGELRYLGVTVILEFSFVVNAISSAIVSSLKFFSFDCCEAFFSMIF